jgi:hypothetical protein
VRGIQFPAPAATKDSAVSSRCIARILVGPAIAVAVTNFNVARIDFPNIRAAAAVGQNRKRMPLEAQKAAWRPTTAEEPTAFAEWHGTPR